MSRSVLVLGLLWTTARGQVNRQLQPEDLLAVRGVNDVQISPDGKEVAFDVTEPANPSDHARSRITNIWTVPVDGSAPPQPLSVTPASKTAPRWSPDGKYLAFLSPAGPYGKAEKAAQIYLIRAGEREAKQLTYEKGGVRAFKWSSDGSMIAFTAKDTATAEDQRRAQEGDDAVEVDHNYTFTRLCVVSLANRKVEVVPQQKFQVNDFEWSPDGNEFALRISATPRLDDAFWHARLVVIQRATGEIVRALSNDISPWEGTLRWSPDGRTVAFPEFTPRRIASRLALEPTSGGPARYLLNDYHGTLRGEQWASDSKYLVAETEVGTKAELLRVNAGTGEVMKLAEALANASETSFSTSADGSTVAYLCEKPDSPNDVCALSAPQVPRRLTNFHSALAGFHLGQAKEITWRNKQDGELIYGVLITPPSFMPGQACPTVVLVHGGPIMTWSTGWNEWGQLLASHGYVVFLPNPRGSEGQGWRFAESNSDDWGGKDFQDIMDGIDSLVRQKIADPNRLGVGGWSFGGFMTAWAVTQTNRFKAAVEGAGITDLINFEGTSEISPTFLTIYFPGSPFRDLSSYKAHSPMYHLANCKTPVLILHGLTDDVVPLGQSQELYSGLKALGVETELVLYPREWHVFSEPVHQLDVLKRVLAWYDKYLK